MVSLTIGHPGIVGSLDVVSLYPSLDIYVCGIVVAMGLIGSEVVFRNLCWHEIALYLMYQLGSEPLDCWTDLLDVDTLSDWRPKRRHNRRHPKFECSGSDLDKSVRFEPWIFSGEVPEVDVVRNMFCIAGGVMVKKTMELHDFAIDGKIFRQKKGGSIGLDLTGVVSDIFMIVWDRILLNVMTENSINAIVYGRYKDDVNFVLDVGGEEGETEIGIERDRRVMEIVENLANGVHQSIKVEVDCGYNHPERKGRVPILDVEVWVGETEDGSVRILHSHYVKDVSSRLVMACRSVCMVNTQKGR